jgi:hypothetical protein
VDFWNDRLYRLFGLNLASAFPFLTPLEAGTGLPDVSFGEVASAPFPRPADSAPLYRSPKLIDGAESFSYLYRLPDCEVLRFSYVADFYLGADRIAGHLLDPAYRHLLELRLLGPVLCYWLERAGLPVLHASAVAINGKAVGFLSTNHGGKTGLAAALLQAGAELLTDDLLAVEETPEGFLARPSYPQMRMWPDEATHFLGGYEDLPIVHPDYTKRRVPVDRFSASARPLTALYLPERQEGGKVRIEPVSPSTALLEIVRHSFSPYLVEAVGWQPRRLEVFSRLVKTVPVRRLLYPSGFPELPRVAAAILQSETAGP